MAISLLAIAPLWICYELGLKASGAQVANGGEVLLQRVFYLFGETHGPLIWRIVLATVFFAAGVFALRSGAPIVKTVLFIFLEGGLFGLLLGPASMWMQRKVESLLVAGVAAPATDWRGSLLDVSLCLGAGVYEEIVFRLILLSAIYYVVARSSASASVHKIGASIVAILLSALMFSGFHYWPAGEAFAWKTFLYRSIAGAVLGTIFIFRGLGVAVCTHASYDILTILLY
jgi:hypothetical protein